MTLQFKLKPYHTLVINENVIPVPVYILSFDKHGNVISKRLGDAPIPPILIQGQQNGDVSNRKSDISKLASWKVKAYQ